MSEQIHILVVEDSPEMQVAIEHTLGILLKAFKGSTITPVENWTDALVVLSRAEDRPDVAVMDLKLPGTTRDEMIDNLKKVKSVCPVVVLTGFASPEDVQKIKEMGIELIEKQPGFGTKLIRALSGLLIEHRLSLATTADLATAEALRNNVTRIREIVESLASQHVEDT